MKINDRVYVSVLSTSRVAGEVGTVRAISVRGEVKVENDFGVVGYPNIRHCKVNPADAPVSAERSHVIACDGFTTGSDGLKRAVPRDQSKPHSDYVVDTDVAHMYLTQIKPLVIKDPVDLLCKAVNFDVFLTGGKCNGWVTDQWIEDGVELLNVVHDGDYSVIPRSCMNFVLKFRR